MPEESAEVRYTRQNTVSLLHTVELAYGAACVALDVPQHPGIVRQGTGNWPNGPVLCEDFDDTGLYAIVWDGGSTWVDANGNDDWVMTVTEALAGRFAVYAEPTNHWAVCLYPYGDQA